MSRTGGGIRCLDIMERESSAGHDHGTEHVQRPAVHGAVLWSEHQVKADMLTLPNAMSNHALDVSILERARDEKTSGRKVEETVFEVIATEAACMSPPRTGR